MCVRVRTAMVVVVVVWVCMGEWGIGAAMQCHSAAGEKRQAYAGVEEKAKGAEKEKEPYPPMEHAASTTPPPMDPAPHSHRPAPLLHGLVATAFRRPGAISISVDVESASALECVSGHVYVEEPEPVH
jgi:hypothetical protein